MSKIHPEAFVEWVANGSAAPNGTINGPAALANIRTYVTFVVISFSAATATTAGTVTLNFGGGTIITVQVPVGTSQPISLSWTKAIRGDVNFQVNAVTASFTAGPTIQVSMGGYKVRE